MKNTSLSLRVFRFILTVSWWGSIGLAVVAVLAMFGALIFSGPEPWEFSYMGYASDIETSALSVTDKNGNVGGFEFKPPTYVNVSFPIETTIGRLKLISLVGVVGGIVFTVFLLFLKQLRGILNTLDSRDPFVSENARRVRTIGILLLVATFGQSLLVLIVTGYADASLNPVGFALDGHLEFDFTQLFAGLSVLVLSEVFRHGTKMREEQELTV